mgnify:FL=1
MDKFAYKIGNITCDFFETIGMYGDTPFESICGYDFSDIRDMGYIAIIVICIFSIVIKLSLKKK